MAEGPDLRALYGEEYVERFERSQSAWRLVGPVPVSETETVADFACGNAMLMEFLAPRVNLYVGVDFSDTFIAAARRRRARLGLENVELVCVRIEEFCASSPGRFHRGFAMDFAEHVYDAEWLGILRAIRRSLQPPARLYLHKPNADFFLERMKASNFLVKQFPEHVAVRSPRDNARILERAGFRVVRLERIAHYNLLRFLHPLSRVPGLGRSFEARLWIEAVA